MGGAFLRRVKLRNYKSIAACDVALGPLCLLVGPNGAGKSNFLDALRLVADSLNHPLDHALRHRGGIDDVRRRSTGHPHNFAIELDFAIQGGPRGRFTFEVAAKGKGGFEIKRERLQAQSAHPLQAWDLSYDVRRGSIVECSVDHPPRASRDRLYLVNLSGTPGFRAIYDSLTSMGFYNMDPVQIRSIQAPDPGATLARDGRNIASVVWRLSQEDAQSMQLVRDYLRRVVNGIHGVERVQVANKETLEFRQEVRGAAHPWKFYANSMSDGTLRALGVLVALYQRGAGDEQRVPLVGLEEPESALHPAAAGVLLEALQGASLHTQVLATTHSPQLLDDDRLQDRELLAVRASQGVTSIGPIAAAGRKAMRQDLFTAGELLAQDRLVPEAEAVTEPEQLSLFGAPEAPE